MKDLKKLTDGELLREMFGRCLAYWRVSQLRGEPCFPDYPVHNAVAKPLAIAEHEAREAVLARMQNCAPSRAWNGVGPKRDCFLRLEWTDGSSEWCHYEWRDNDIDQHEGYYSETRENIAGYDLYKFSPTHFKVTHWADLPELEL